MLLEEGLLTFTTQSFKKTKLVRSNSLTKKIEKNSILMKIITVKA